MPLPKWFKPVVVVALLWNLIGCASYLFDVTRSPEAIAALPADQQAMWAARPAWGVSATAVAVWFGALGCIGLLLRKRWAASVLLVSLIGVVAQDIGMFFLSGVPAGSDAIPASAYAIQGMVLLISIALLMLARRANREGWLT
ncbi:MAG: hypothetical protein V4503_09570 [Gemmatimonadota bacterium]